MRKDLKIGMAIGAVLLVVVIVYFAMPKPDETEVAGTGEVIDPAAAVDPDAGAPEPAPHDEPAAEPASPPAPSVAADAPGWDDPPARDAGGFVADDATADLASGGDGGSTNWAEILRTGREVAPLRTVTPPVTDRNRTGGGDSGAAGPVLRDGDASTAVPFGIPPARAGGAATGDLDTRPDPPPAAGDPTAEAGASAPGAATPRAPARSATSALIPTEQDTGAGRTHVMKKNETFSSIAKLLYGDGRHYLAIQEANPDLDPTRLRPGTVINLPDPGAVTATRTAGGEPDGNAPAVATTIDPKTEYEVKSNDSLHRIAARWYGTSSLWERIYEVNQDMIGPDPAKLKVGTILKMPPNPDTAADTASR